MKSFLLYCLCLSLFLLSTDGFGQCNNSITVTSGGTAVATVNKAQSGGSFPVCPTAGAHYSFSGTSTSAANLTWVQVITAGLLNTSDVVSAPLATGSYAAGIPLSIKVDPTVATTYRFESKTTGCTGGSVSDDFVYFTFTPSLTLSSSAGATGICVGNSATLSASGSSSGTYTWAANGTTVANQSASTLTVHPIVTTTYTVTAVTSCGTSSQQITVPVKTVTISPSAPVICSGQETSLTASYSGSSATYSWTVVGGNGATIAPTSTTATSATISVAPIATTTYQAVATTDDCGVITRQRTVTVSSAAITASVSPTTSTICSGSSITLTGSSNYTNATYIWRADGVPIVGAVGNTYDTPTTTTGSTSYTVTAATSCGGTPATATSTVNRAQNATFAVSPANTSTTPFALCSGTSETLTANSNITNATYQWHNNAAPGALITTSPSLTISPVVTAATSYHYNVTTTTSCGTSTQSVFVTVNPSVSVNPTSSSIVKGNHTTLTAHGATTYSWSPPTGLSATTGEVITANPTVTTTYTVTGNVTAAAPCSNTALVTVTVTAPLPVELTSFEVTWMSSYPVLRWSTSSELNSSHFEVERSMDGVDYTTIARISTQGSKVTTSNYTHTDATETLRASILYYRLHQIDVDRMHAYSPVRTVKTNRAMTGLFVFPNPARGTSTLVGAATGTSVQILDALGRVVFATMADATGTTTLALPANLPKGVYLVRSGNKTARLSIDE